jgi:hypothetical protein
MMDWSLEKGRENNEKENGRTEKRRKKESGKGKRMTSGDASVEKGQEGY